MRAAIVGLGQVGSRFDEEPRPSIWSHAGAYLALPSEYELVAGADPDPDQRGRFHARCPAAQLFDDPVAMLAETRPDVVSVCTPPAGRARLVTRLLSAWRPRVLVCEKPLELVEQERRELVDQCAKADVQLIVNYTRRYERTYREARAAIAAGRIGRVESVTVRAPNRLWSIGSHAVNLLTYLAGELPVAWSIQPAPRLDEGGEPAANALFELAGGAAGALLTMGRRDVLLFEADVVGESGRILISGNGAEVTLTPFVRSDAFVGYRVPGAAVTLATRDHAHSPFVELAAEAASLVRGGAACSSDGAGALATESIVEALIHRCQKRTA